MSRYRHYVSTSQGNYVSRFNSGRDGKLRKEDKHSDNKNRKTNYTRLRTMHRRTNLSRLGRIIKPLTGNRTSVEWQIVADDEKSHRPSNVKNTIVDTRRLKRKCINLHLSFAILAARVHHVGLQ